MIAPDFGGAVTRRLCVAIAVSLVWIPACHGGAVPPKDAVAVSIPPSRESDVPPSDIRHLVKGLPYSDQVAEDFARMVGEWKNKQKKPALDAWKQKLDRARRDNEKGRLSTARLARMELEIAKELGETIRKQIGVDDIEKLFDLADVITRKRAQCSGYAESLYITGTFVGLSVQVINVIKPIYGVLSGQNAHVANIVSLSDGRTIMLDLMWGFTSKPFVMEEDFAMVGNYRELRDKANPAGTHRKIQIYDRNGLIAGIHTNRGRIRYDSGQNAEALAEWTKAIEFNPQSAEAHYNRGTAYTRLNQPAAAISDWTRAIELNPEYAQAYCNRGGAYNRSSKFSEALADCTKAIELRPELAPAYCSRGLAYCSLGQFPAAIADCDKAIELNPRYAEAYYNRGTAYGKSGQLPQAITDFTKAIELNPNYAEAYYNRGAAYHKSGQLPQAIADLTRVIEFNPKAAIVYCSRGQVYAASGAVVEARNDLLKGVELNPDLKPQVRKISDQFKLDLPLDDSSTADGMYTRAIELNPNDAQAYCNRANTYNSQGRYTLAISDCTKAIELNPKHAQAYCSRGIAHHNMGNHTQAVADYTKAIELNPQFVEAYYNRGAAYSKAGQLPQAIPDYTKAVELNPKFAEAYYNRGVAHGTLGNREDARRDLLRAIELNSALKALVEKASKSLGLQLQADDR